MTIQTILKGRVTIPLILAVSLLLLSAGSWAAASTVIETKEPGRIQLVSGKSIILKSPQPTKRVSIANPEIADFVLVSPNEVYIIAKAAGLTNLTLWQNNSVYAIYDLEVAYDVSRLKQKLHDVLPDEDDLRVISTHDSITLSGRVSNASSASQATALARSYAPEGKVNNLIEVAGVHQVMLEVRIAEMSRQLIRRLGVNFNFVTSTGKFGISQLGGLTQLVSPDNANIGPVGDFGTFVTPAANAIFRFGINSTTWTGFIDALRQDGLVKILAEPNLMALSGQDAYFLAGGEFPVPVPQGLGTVGIEYKPFGVGLSFTPTVLSDKKISIKVAPEVSELDFSTAVRVEGFVTPGLTTRKASTTVELGDGQSFAIAGILRDTVRDVMDKYPLLGDIPILGTLFRSREFQRNETELIIIVTPHLVKPLDMANQPLPTDFYKQPNAAEFYLLGMMEGQQENQARGEMDGDFGHATPKSE